MLGAPRHGLAELHRINIFVRAIVDVIDHYHPDGTPGLAELEPLITEQLLLLEAALIDARMRRECEIADETAASRDPETEVREDLAEDEATLGADEPQTGVHRRALHGMGHAVAAKAMEEKLRDERAPVQDLLRKDCVNLGLVDPKKAERMVLSMTGKSPEEGEKLVVEQLREVLQKQVKGMIRRLKGGPWATPRAQEEMRQDIHNARSVRSILMLARQIGKERQAWEKKHGVAGGFASFFRSHKGLG
jgi:hypothetical protein